MIPAMDKTCASADAAIADLPDDAVIMSSGFGLCGNPENLIRALAKKGTRRTCDHRQQLRDDRQKDSACCSPPAR